MVGSLRDGVLASPVAFTPFEQAWVPLYLEWRLDLALDDRAARWALTELDFEPAVGEQPAGPDAMTVSGRSLLTSAGAKAFSDRVTEYLAQEQKLDRAGMGEISDANANELRGIAGHTLYADVLSAATERLREYLLGFDTDTGVAQADTDATPAVPTREPLLFRAGTARLSAVRIVDAFGRSLTVPDNMLQQMVVSEALRMPDAAAPGNNSCSHLASPPRPGCWFGCSALRMTRPRPPSTRALSPSPVPSRPGCCPTMSTAPSRSSTTPASRWANCATTI